MSGSSILAKILQRKQSGEQPEAMLFNELKDMYDRPLFATEMLSHFGNVKKTELDHEWRHSLLTSGYCLRQIMRYPCQIRQPGCQMNRQPCQMRLSMCQLAGIHAKYGSMCAKTDNLIANKANIRSKKPPNGGFSCLLN